MKVYKIKVNGKVYEVEVEVFEKEGVISDHEIENISPLNSKINGELVKSPIQGKISYINVKKGDRVLKGDVLLIIEAMKMENEIVANTSGVIVDVFVVQGKQVDSEEVLLVIK